MSDPGDFRTRQANLGQLVTDFPAWLSSRDKETRSSYIQHIGSFPEAERETEKVRLVNMFAVSELKRIPFEQVVDNWEAIRPGFAHERGEEWSLQADNEIGFNRMLQRDMARKRDVQGFLEGRDDDPQSQMDSLASLTFSAAALEQPSGSAFIEWERRSRGKPGFGSVDLVEMEQLARDLHNEATKRLAPVLRLAGEAYQSISGGHDLEDYSKVLLDRFNDLDSRQQRDFLAVLRIKADSAPDPEQATFWGNMSKATSRAAGNTGRSLVDAGAAIFNEAKFTVAVGLLGTDPLEEYNELERKRQEHDLESDLRRIEEQNYSPIREVMGDYMAGWVERGLYGAPQALMSTGVALIPYAGLPATFATMTMQSYEEERFRLLDAGLGRAEASQGAATLAPIMALPNTLLEKLGASALIGKVPVLSDTLQSLSNKVGGGLSGYLLRATGGSVTELSTEGAQGLTTSLVEAAAAALDRDMPDVVWRNGKNGVFDGLWTKSGETFVSILPMALLGAADGGRSRVAALHGASDLDLRAFGARGEDILSFRQAAERSPGEAVAAVERLLANRDAFSDSARAATAEIANMERLRARTTGAQLQSDMQEAGVQRILRDKGGWSIVHADGQQTRVGSGEAARAIVSDLKQAATRREADALVSLIDRWHDSAPAGISRETALTGESARSDGRKISYSRNGVLTREVTGEVDLQNLRNEARMDAKMNGSMEIDVAINGANWVGRMAHGAREMYQRLEINNSPSAALTFLHESVEADWRMGIRGGAITREETQRAIASIARGFDPSTARNAEERAFRERVQRVARNEANDTELRETLSELAVADVLGRRRDGTPMPAGSISATLDAALRQAANPAEVREIGKLRAFLRTVRNNFRALFGTIAALRKAKHAGGTAEFEALVNKLFGKDWQAAMEWNASQDAQLASEQSTEQGRDTEGAAYSLSAPRHGRHPISQAPVLLEARPSPLNGSKARTLTERLSAWRDWVAGRAGQWKGAVQTAEGEVRIPEDGLNDAFKREGEDRALHFEAAARVEELLENSVLASVDVPRSYHPRSPDLHQRYARMKFADGHVRNVLLTIKRTKPETGADPGLVLESVEVQTRSTGAASAATAGESVAAGNKEADLQAFLAGIKPEHRHVEGQDNGERRKVPKSSMFESELSQDVRTYLRAVEHHTGLRLHPKQREAISAHLRQNSHTRLTPEDGRRHRRKFDRVRAEQIAEWERQTQQTWPRYAEDVPNDSGGIDRLAGDFYDAHHLIENVYNGPHIWWNLTPARFPDAHQLGIHREAIMKDLFRE